MKPNTLMLDWFPEVAGVGATDYLDILKDTQLTDMHLLLCRKFDELNTDNIRDYFKRTGKKMFIDVWALPLSLQVECMLLFHSPILLFHSRSPPPYRSPFLARKKHLQIPLFRCILPFLFRHFPWANSLSFICSYFT